MVRRAKHPSPVAESQIASYARVLESRDPADDHPWPGNRRPIEALQGLASLWPRMPAEMRARWHDRLFGLALAYLDARDAWLGAEAVHTAEAIGGQDAVPALARLLDADPLPRYPRTFEERRSEARFRNAVRALGRLGPDPVRDRLLALLRCGGPAVIHVIWALGRMRQPDPKVVRALVAGLDEMAAGDERSYEEGRLAGEIRESLAQLGPVALERVERLARDPRTVLNGDRLKILARAGADGWREECRRAQEHPDWRIRLAAAAAFITAAHRDPTALEALKAAARDPDPRVRENVAWRLAYTSLPADDVLDILSRDPDPEVSHWAEDTVIHRVNRAGAERLRSLLADDRPKVREAAHLALVKLGDEDALAATRARLADPEARQESARLLAWYGGQADYEALLPLLDTGEEYAPDFVVMLLKQLPGRDREERRRLAERLAVLLEDRTRDPLPVARALRSLIGNRAEPLLRTAIRDGRLKPGF